jgi:hypothetical protein
MAFDEPIGVYLVGFERARLRTPNGSVPPAEWFTFSRGRGPEATEDGRARCQRLAIEVPEGSGFGLCDLVDAATAQPISWGGQLADMTQLAVYLRVGANGSATLEEGPLIEPKAH